MLDPRPNIRAPAPHLRVVLYFVVLARLSLALRRSHLWCSGLLDWRALCSIFGLTILLYFQAIGCIAQLAPSASQLKSSGVGRRLRFLADNESTPMPAKLQIQAIFDSVVASMRRERHAKRVAADMLGHSAFSRVAADSVSAPLQSGE